MGTEENWHSEDMSITVRAHQETERRALRKDRIMVKDPVCGMEADEKKIYPPQAAYMGKTYYFSCKNRRSTFESNPEEYVDAYRRQKVPYKRKVVVVGTGQVGAPFSFALMMSGLASASTVRAKSRVWSQVNIEGVLLKDYCAVCQGGCSKREKGEIFQQVKNAAYEIIDRKGYTNFAVSLALVRIVSIILRDENSALTISPLIDDYYEIRDVCLSIPVILNMNGVFRHILIHLDETESRRLKASAETLR
jgi:YHS domain-containing protein